jgi:hypothetical protein
VKNYASCIRGIWMDYQREGDLLRFRKRRVVLRAEATISNASNTLHAVKAPLNRA